MKKLLVLGVLLITTAFYGQNAEKFVGKITSKTGELTEEQSTKVKEAAGVMFEKFTANKKNGPAYRAEFFAAIKPVLTEEQWAALDSMDKGKAAKTNESEESSGEGEGEGDAKKSKKKGKKKKGKKKKK